MKILFRTLVLVGMITIISLQLVNNRKTTRDIVEMAELEIEAVPVKVYKATMKSPHIVISSAGKVTADSEVMVVSEANGKIINTYVKPGQSIKRGTVLAKVDGFYIQQELEIARKNYQKLSKDLGRYSKLSKENAISGQQMEQLVLQKESARTQVEIIERRLSNTSIVSPIEGTVNQFYIKVGQSIGAGTVIAEVVNKELLTIESSLFRDEVDLLKSGMQVSIISNMGNLEAVVSSVSIKPDRTGKYPFEVTPDKGSEILKPGMIVNLEGKVELSRKIIVPESALVSQNGAWGVFVIEENLPIYRTVVMGSYYDREVEILSGITEGEFVITSGNQFINEGDEILILE